MVSYLIDVVLAVMLVTATVYLVLVNRRLSVLQSGQSEINGLIATFSRTIDDTDASVKRMVASATEVSARLADELDRAKTVKEDMTVLLDSVERTAARIEETVQHARALARRLDSAPMRATAPPPPAAAPLAAPLVAPARAGEEPTDPAPTAASPAVPAPTPFVPESFEAAPARPAAAPTPERAASPAVGAFYARLRTVGTEA